MNYHGYRQHHKSHSDRPWWRSATWSLDDGEEVEGWERTDGARFHLRHYCPCQHAGDRCKRTVLAEPGPGQGLESIGEPAGHHYPIGVMEHIDRGNPLPPPPPLCGQVWKRADRPAQMVVSEEVPWFTVDLAVHIVWVSSDRVGFPPVKNDWPPPGAILVAGPGSPWQPPETT